MSATTIDHRAATEPATSHISPARAVSAIVLGAWAATFWFILLADRAAFYLSSRTDWVIPVGAVFLTIAALGRALTLRTDDPEPLRRREAVILGLFLAPVALIVILPPQTLSSFAVERRPVFAAGVSGPGTEISGEGSLTMLQVAGAQSTRRGLDRLAAHAGEHVRYTGFVVVHPTTPADEFMLNRFVISCCAADAQSASIRVVGVAPGTFTEDEWVTVDGTIYPIGREVIIQADSVEPVPEPEQPYLTP